MSKFVIINIAYGVNQILYSLTILSKSYVWVIVMSIIFSCRVNVDALTADITQLANKVKSLAAQLEKSSPDLQKQFSTFLTAASKEVTLVQADINEIDAIKVDLAEYFAEDLKTFKLEECFQIMRYGIVKNTLNIDYLHHTFYYFIQPSYCFFLEWEQGALDSLFVYQCALPIAQSCSRASGIISFEWTS